LFSYRSALDQGSDQIATLVGLCCFTVRKYTIVNVVDVLDYGIGGDDSAVKGCGACKGRREEDSGKASEMHVEDFSSMLQVEKA
jgi:hypothetical protein